MFADVVEALLGRSFASRPARLSGYARFSLRGRVYPAIVAREGSSIDGVLYEGLDGPTLTRLDEFEGETYERRTVDVRPTSTTGIATGEALSAEVYVIGSGELHLLEEEPWDPESFRALHSERYVAHCRALRARGGGAVAFES